MNNFSDKRRYLLLQIDVTDTYPMADVFDEEKYPNCIQSDVVEELLDFALMNFSKEKFILVNPHGVIFRSSMLLLPNVMGSILLIRKYHGKQKRKGDDFPYIEHPLEVGYRLWRDNFPNDVVIAGFCHDLLEDTKCKEQEIIENCGAGVLKIVKAVSNDETLSDNKDWEKKKEKYIRSVEAGGEKAIAVSVMDKICNLKSFFDQYEKEGPDIWKRFNRGKEKKLWFEKAVLQMAKKNWEHPLLGQLEKLVQQLEKTQED